MSAIRLLACASAPTLALALALSPAAAQAQAPASPPAAQPSPDQPQQTAPKKTAPSKQQAAPGQSPNAVSTVTVQASQAPVRTSIDRRSYSVATDLKGSSGSLADALRNVPGAQVDLDGNLTLRGGAVQIMIDGQPSQVFNGRRRPRPCSPCRPTASSGSR